MKAKYYSVLFVLLFVCSNLRASDSPRERYITQWKDVAIAQMHEHGIPASITLAQAILESGNGQSELTRKANNHFGIKCHGWDGPGVYHDDDKKGECFRKYKRAEDSFEDHSLFLKKARYADLFTYRTTDYKSWAKGLKKAGYATDPAYAKRLIKLIEENDLAQYDTKRLATRKKDKPRTSGQDKESRPRYTSAKPGISSPTSSEIDLTSTLEVKVHPNAIKFIKARAGDTPAEIALSLDMAPWQILRYNDLDKEHRYTGGEIVFLQPKRNKAKAAYHLAASGETLRAISQRQGVKLKKLVDYNGGAADAPLSAGTKVKLRK